MNLPVFKVDQEFFCLGVESVAWKCCRVPMCAKMIFDMRQK